MKVEETQGGGWSDLPGDIIRSILDKLCWADRIRLTTVCKSWYVPRSLIPTAGEFPWLLLFNQFHALADRPGTLFDLFDTLNQKGYEIDKRIEVEDREIFFRNTITSSRFGWLLLRNLKFSQTCLFSPITGEVIKLPNLKQEENFYWRNVAAFSMNSTSPECVVFIFWRERNGCGYSTCRVGDDTWNTVKLKNLSEEEQKDYHLNPVDATYAGGSFYCLFKDWKVGVFNIALQQWKLLEVSRPRPEFPEVCSTKFLHTDAHDLLLPEYEFSPPPLNLIRSIQVPYLPPPPNLSRRTFQLYLNDFIRGLCHGRLRRIWRYDISNKCWMAEQNFSNRAIFVNKNTRYYAFEAAGKKGEFAENIHLGCRYADDECERLPEEKKCSTQMQEIIWFDQRLVWRKHDLLQRG